MRENKLEINKGVVYWLTIHSTFIIDKLQLTIYNLQVTIYEHSMSLVTPLLAKCVYPMLFGRFQVKFIPVPVTLAPLFSTLKSVEYQNIR